MSQMSRLLFSTRRNHAETVQTLQKVLETRFQFENYGLAPQDCCPRAKLIRFIVCESDLKMET